MDKQTLLFALAFSAFMLSYSFAGTVVLTGSCTRFVTNNSFKFSITNSGNDSAYDLLINPYIANAAVAGNYSANILQPGTTANFSIRLSNVTAKGTYADYVVVTYSQGSSFFSTMFPCLLSFNNATTPEIYLSTSLYKVNSSVAAVNVSVFNAAKNNITANVSLLVPPFVSFEGPSSFSALLKPFSTYHFQFKLNLTNAKGISFTIAATASYIASKSHFAAMAILGVSQQAKTFSSNIGSVLLFGIAALIALLVLLIAFVFVRSRKKRREKD